MNNFELLDLIRVEQKRCNKLWVIREAQPIGRLLGQDFIENINLIDDNRETFDEIYDRFLNLLHL